MHLQKNQSIEKIGLTCCHFELNHFSLDPLSSHHDSMATFEFMIIISYRFSQRQHRSRHRCQDVFADDPILEFRFHPFIDLHHNGEPIFNLDVHAKFPIFEPEHHCFLSFGCLSPFLS